MALLDQLRDAVVEQGAEQGKGPSSSGSRSPLDVAALDLWTAVGHSAAETAAAVGVPAGKSPADTMRAVMPHIAHASLPVLVWIGEEWSEWVSKIQEYLQPTRRTPIDRACPVCHQKLRICRDEFGATVQKPCLVAVWDVEGSRFSASSALLALRFGRVLSCGICCLPTRRRRRWLDCPLAGDAGSCTRGMMTLDCLAYHWCVLCLAGGGVMMRETCSIVSDSSSGGEEGNNSLPHQVPARKLQMNSGRRRKRMATSRTGTARWKNLRKQELAAALNAATCAVLFVSLPVTGIGVSSRIVPSLTT